MRTLTTGKPTPTRRRTVAPASTVQPVLDISLAAVVPLPLDVNERIWGKWTVFFPGLGSEEWQISGEATVAEVAGWIYSRQTCCGICTNVSGAFILISIDRANRLATVSLKPETLTMPLGSRFRAIVTGKFLDSGSEHTVHNPSMLRPGRYQDSYYSSYY